MIKKKEEVKKGRHSRNCGPQDSGISLLYVVNQIRKKLPCFTKAGKAGDPRLRHSGMTPSFSKAFTLIELLVVVLIIGILAAVALPQYQKAVDKSRVATILPLMRRWSDALALYKLEHGSYVNEEGERPSAEDLGVSWPSDWECDGLECKSSLWYCYPNEEQNGMVSCGSLWKAEDEDIGIMENFTILITQPDDTSYPAGKLLCYDTIGTGVCKFLTSKAVPGFGNYYEF